MLLVTVFKTGNVCMYKRNTEEHSRNHYCRENAKSFTYSECGLVTLVVQYAMRVRRIMSSVASLVVPHFSTISHKLLDFRGNVIEHKMCVLIFSTSLVPPKNLILRRIQRGMIIHEQRSSCKVPIVCT
jgi:hypothetical protein